MGAWFIVKEVTPIRCTGFRFSEDLFSFFCTQIHYRCNESLEKLWLGDAVLLLFFFYFVCRIYLKNNFHFDDCAFDDDDATLLDAFVERF
jgi:hypothetical protein